MERLSKRPRLSTCPPIGRKDDELNRRRALCDLTLRSKWELIFQKYGHDFEGIGDEIDVVSGAIAVDNGHLKGMRREGDTGCEQPARLDVNRSALARAITKAPKGLHKHEAEDESILRSIESMWEGAIIIASDSEEDEAEDDKQLPHPRCQDGAMVPLESATDPETQRSAIRAKTMTVTLEEAEADFEDMEQHMDASESTYTPETSTESPRRSQSASHSAHSKGTNTTHRATDSRSSIDSDLQYDTVDISDNALLRKFGHQVGNQVLDFLRQRRAADQAHIDPEWQVPEFGQPLPTIEPDWQSSTVARQNGTSAKSNFQERQSLTPSDSEVISIESDEDVLQGHTTSARLPSIASSCSSEKATPQPRPPIKLPCLDKRLDKKRKAQRVDVYPELTLRQFRWLVVFREKKQMRFDKITDISLFDGQSAESLRKTYMNYRENRDNFNALKPKSPVFRPWSNAEDEHLLKLKKDLRLGELEDRIWHRSDKDITNRLVYLWSEQDSAVRARGTSQRAPASTPADVSKDEGVGTSNANPFVIGIDEDRDTEIQTQPKLVADSPSEAELRETQQIQDKTSVAKEPLKDLRDRSLHAVTDVTSASGIAGLSESNKGG